MNSTNELRQSAILSTVRSAADPWLPELTESLVDSGWQALSQEIGISPATYSTTNVIRQRPMAPSKDMLVSVPSGRGKFAGFIEFLPDDVRAHFESRGHRFPIANEVAQWRLGEALCRALELIALVPSLHASSMQLVRCVHLLESTAVDCDVSFSDPDLPFSIFVSVPRADSPNATLRLAEAVIHESMHLQLSLLEKMTPITSSKSQTYYSPWKKSNRDASGMLHALYVFTVIDAWLKRLPALAGKYPEIRRREIADQVAEITSFGSVGLTEVGDMLRRKLFSQH